MKEIYELTTHHLIEVEKMNFSLLSIEEGKATNKAYGSLRH